MEETYEAFRDKIKNITGERHHKITNSYGVYDMYKFYRKNKPLEKKYVLTESQYFTIIRRINELLSDDLIELGKAVFPHRMGDIEIRKYENKPRIDAEGNLVFNAPIDWDRTLKLWHDDVESYHNKVLIKIETTETFKVLYNKTTAIYNNKSFYQFTLNKNLKLRIRKRVRDGKLDAFESSRNKETWLNNM